jgi:hypothetical protein
MGDDDQETSERMTMITDAARIAGAVRNEVDETTINADRDFDDEMVSSVVTAADTGTVAEFFENLRTQLEVRFVDDEEVPEIVERYDTGGQARAFLKTARNNAALVVYEMKQQQGTL